MIRYFKKYINWMTRFVIGVFVLYMLNNYIFLGWYFKHIIDKWWTFYQIKYVDLYINILIIKYFGVNLNKAFAFYKFMIISCIIFWRIHLIELFNLMFLTFLLNDNYNIVDMMIFFFIVSYISNFIDLFSVLKCVGFPCFICIE